MARGFLCLIAVINRVSCYVLAGRFVESARCELLHRSPGGRPEPGSARDLQHRSRRTASSPTTASTGVPHAHRAHEVVITITTPRAGLRRSSATRQSGGENAGARPPLSAQRMRIRARSRILQSLDRCLEDRVYLKPAIVEWRKPP